MAAFDVLKASRPQLVTEAKKKGLKVFKSQTDDEIREMLAGASKFKDIATRDVEKAAEVSSKLHVVNRTQDCFGLAFDPADDACSTRCPLTAKCVKAIIEKANVLLADEKARAKDEASHKEAVAAFNKGKGPNPGPFQPKPIGGYVEPAQAPPAKEEKKPKATREVEEARKPIGKIGAITPETKVKVLMGQEALEDLSNAQWRTVCETLVEMRKDITDYEAFEMVVAEVTKGEFKKAWKPDVIKEFAKALRMLGHIKVG